MNLRAGGWQRTLGRVLQGRRLGILGYGTIGPQVARIGTAFGMQVWVWGGEGSRARARQTASRAPPIARLSSPTATC